MAWFPDSHSRYPSGRLVLTGVLSVIMLLSSSTSLGAQLPSSPAEQVPSLMEAAHAAFKERRFQEAVGLYTRAAGIAPGETSAFLGRGMAYEMLGRATNAQDDYKKALECDLENYRAMENLAGIYERSGKKTAEAIQLYRKALELDPRPDMQENLVVWIAMLETRLNGKGESAVGMWNRGNEEVQRGRLELAESCYSRAIELNPRMYQAYFSRGILRTRTRDATRAIADLEKGVRIDPRFPGGWILKGLALEQAGEREKARRDFEFATEVDPKDPAAHYHLGRMLEGAHEFRRALQSYEAAARLKPKPDLLKLVQERIAAVKDRARAAAGEGTTLPKDRQIPW